MLPLKSLKVDTKHPLDGQSVQGVVVDLKEGTLIIEIEGGMQIAWPVSRISHGFQSMIKENDPIGMRVRLALFSGDDFQKEREQTAKAILNEIINT